MASDAQTTITEAIQSARYNEAVVVTVNDNAAPREIVLVACLDSENGGIVWKDAALASGDGDGSFITAISGASSAGVDDDHGANFPADMGIVRHLRTKRWALPMLNDHRRNHLYGMAIREACHEMVKRRNGTNDINDKSNDGNDDGMSNDGDGNSKNEDSTIRILDIGSGTGLLSLMGARHTLDAIDDDQEQEHRNNGPIKPKPTKAKVQVTSVEMASAMARLARKTIDENGSSDNIVVVENHSTDVDFGIDDALFFNEKDGKKRPNSNNDSTTTNKTNQRADICTSELLESGLLGEGVLPALRDAWTRHLKPDAIVVPRRARVYAVLVEGMPIVNGKNDDSEHNEDVAESKRENVVNNAATSFLGPELHSFREASGGVWLSTTSAPSPAAAALHADHDQPQNGDVLLGTSCSENTSEKGESGIGGINVPLHADAMLDENYREKSATLSKHELVGFRGIRPLTDPTMVLDFDFASGLDALPPPAGRTIAMEVTPIADGVCAGVLFWWELDLWDGNRDDCTYSTEPIEFANRRENAKSKKSSGSKSLWQDHWQQCLFVFGHDHHSIGNSSRQLTKGSAVELISSHDDSSISFSINTNSGTSLAGSDAGAEKSKEERPLQRRRLNEDNKSVFRPQQSLLNRSVTATRALQLNDSSRMETLTKAIRYCIHVKGRDAPLLDLSDMGICALIASVSAGASKVTSLESSSGTLPTLAATIAQIGNGLPRPGTEFQIIQALAEHISEEHIAGGAAEIVTAEPYYEMLEGWHLQEALNYFYLVRSLKARGVIAPTALSVPSYAKVMACVVEFDEFYSAYGQVGDVAGFKHASVNHYGDRYHTYDVSLPLWQYRYKRLSEEGGSCVAKISYEGAVPTIETMNVSVKLMSEGMAQAVVVWVDYACRTSNGTPENGSGGDHFHVISTASSSHRQLVRKLPEPILITEADVKAGATFCCKVSFGNDPVGIEDHSFSFEFCKN